MVPNFTRSQCGNEIKQDPGPLGHPSQWWSGLVGEDHKLLLSIRDAEG